MPKILGYVARYGVGALIGAGVVLVLSAEIKDWLSVRGSDTVIVQAHRTKRVEKWKEVEVPIIVKVPAPPAKDLGKLREDWGRPDLVGAPEKPEVPSGGTPTPGVVPGAVTGALLLGEWDLPKLPYGGKALGVRETDNRVSLTIKGNPRPFFEMPLKWRAGAMFTAWPDKDISGWVGIRTLRLGRFEFSPAVLSGYDWGTRDGRIGLGAVGTFDF